MSRIDPHITIDETAVRRAKDCEHFIRKPLRMDHNNLVIEGPHKVLDGKSVTLKNAKEIIRGIEKPIFESAKRVGRFHSWNRLRFLLEEAGRDQKDGIGGLNDFFNLRKDLRTSQLTVLSLMLLRDPFVTQKFQVTQEGETRVVSLPPIDRTNYERLLDYMHAASKALVLAPDLRVGERAATNVKEYLHFVDDNMQILSTHNNKAIFAPIQPDLPPKDVREILEHYKASNYANIWINFNGGQWDDTYFAKVRGLLRWIDELFGTKGSPGLNSVCLYYSHVKKENEPHLKSDSALSSDIMSQFFSADFIGVNQTKQQGGLNRIDQERRIDQLIQKGEFNNRKEYIDAYKAHHTRVFDPETYYYYKIGKYPRRLTVDVEFVSRDSINRLFNSTLLRSEINRTKSQLDETGQIRPYLKRKRALTDNMDVLERLVPGLKDSDRESLTSKLGSI